MIEILILIFLGLLALIAVVVASLYWLASAAVEMTRERVRQWSPPRRGTLIVPGERPSREVVP